MKFIFNHTFCFVQPAFPEQDTLVKQNLVSPFLREHKGQGTSAKFLFFKQNYMEFIWLSDLRAAQENLLQLHLRANWKATDWNPFGIAFAGEPPKDELKNFINYHPPYRPESSILVDKRSLEESAFPLLFFMSPDIKVGLSEYFPENMLRKNPDWIRNDLDFKKIIYKGPSFRIPKYLASQSLITFHSEGSFKMEVQLCGSSIIPIDWEGFQISNP